MDINTIKKLINSALKAKQNCYAPYSKFCVGAALLSDSGIIYTGVNVENACYSCTNCGERTAFFKAVSEGEKSFKAIAVTGGENNKKGVYCTPCGVCRQIMAEFCNENFSVILANNENDYKIYSLKELLPMAFKL